MITAIVTIGVQIFLGYASFKKAEEDQAKSKKKTAEIDSLNRVMVNILKLASIEQHLTRTSLLESNENSEILNEIDAFELQEVSYLLSSDEENDPDDIKQNIFYPLYSRGKNWKIIVYINTLEGPIELAYDKSKSPDSCLYVKRFNYLNNPFSSTPAVGVNFTCSPDYKKNAALNLSYTIFNTIDSSKLHLAAKHAYKRFLKLPYQACIIITSKNFSEDNVDKIGKEFESLLKLTPLFYLNKEKNQFIYFATKVSSEYVDDELRIYFELDGKPQTNFNGEFYKDSLGVGE
ncbi:hypothetical protein L3C95_09675 [Chitinophaga filiformis]|uniref:hypothetical protein n=1 Tax=Chitinophaga filiformis TaxID=104663 RepID=UPI001F41E72E|nr:hypothetical protein [Chitinophaga filiformis]MCF6403143.1 hypothetical protein [Chitinophaga filiformis]